jgi:hypothetical protein
LNWELILKILITAGLVLLGGLSLYWKQNTKLQQQAGQLIGEAEKAFADTTKAGGQKFEWVVDALCRILPAPIRIFFPRSVISSIVQNAFDAIEAYAKTQLDRFLSEKSDACAE